MERIDPVGRWSSGFPRIERMPPVERSTRDQRRQQSAGDPPPRRRDEDEEEEHDDGHEHVDVTA
jgi:hypothetical protein